MWRNWQWLGLLPLTLLMWEMPAIAAEFETHLTHFDASEMSLAIAQSTREKAPVELPGHASPRFNKQTVEASGILLQVKETLNEDDEILTDGSHYDDYFFAGQIGQIIKITLESQAFDTYLLLDNAMGERVAEIDDDVVGDSTNSEIVVQLPATGKYRVFANSYDDIGSGPYQLTVALATVAELRQAELRNEAAQKQGFQLLDKVTTEIEEIPPLLQVEGALEPAGPTLEDGSFYDEYTLAGQAGQTITINLEGLEFDTKLMLLNPAGDMLRQDHDYESWDSQILVTLPENGDYQVLVSTYHDSYHPQGWGEYILTLFRQESGLASSAIDLQQYDPDNLMWVGDLHYFDDEYEEARRHYQAALATYWEVEDRSGELKALGSLGNVYHSLGEYTQALKYYQQSLKLAQVQESSWSEAVSLGAIGNIYYSLGDYPQALDYYQQALAITRALRDADGEAVNLSSLGNVYYSLGDNSQALDYYQQSLAIANEIVGNSGEAAPLTGIGNVYSSLGDYPQALNYYQQSLAIERDNGWREGEATDLFNIGNVYEKLGDYSQALDYYQQSLAIARDIGAPENAANTLNHIGITLFQMGRLLEAEETLFETVALLESLRVRELGDAINISQFELQKSTYGVLQQVLVARNQPQRALEIAEQGRARALVELLAKPSAPQAPPSINAPNFAQIQQIARRQNSILVEYSLIDTGVGNPQIYIWVIPPDGELHFQQVDLSGEDLAALVMRSREAIGVRNRGGFELAANQTSDTAQLQQLHQLLIAPIAELLPQNAPDQPVIFIPHEELFFVPFPAILDDNGDYLIQKHTILTASSIQVLALTQQQRMALADSESLSADDLLVVGNPVMPETWNPAAAAYRQLAALPGAEQEVRNIADFFDVQPWLNATATEQRIKQQIETARVIHFATHGLLEYGQPDEFGVRDAPGAIALTPSLGEDGLLTSAEIGDFTLQAELVVLSACDTGRGDITGDGVIGLSRSLFEAGTPSVIVSLWSVPDAPTAVLMTEFYRQWRSGLDKAQALRQAMLITMETHPEPRNWAAFILIGEAQ